MALDGGGGGGGGPVGFANSFTGAAQALELVGDHAYAYSGMFGASTTNQTALSFITGNYYFVGEAQVNMAYEYDSSGAAGTAVGYIQIKLNDSTVAQLAAGQTAADSQTTATQDLIIPPYTQVQVDIVCDDNQAARLVACTITGRIYR